MTITHVTAASTVFQLSSYACNSPHWNITFCYENIFFKESLILKFREMYGKVNREINKL